MENKDQIKAKIQSDIHEIAKTIHDLSLKYQEESMMKNLQNNFLSLSVNIGKALDIPLQ
ncbi:MAG: hypothetical protein JSV22_01775 [Bacteroidales bacterium]|nr:MAG: hypothetical protein JSV22_01775 [Bacteroidales bacterium]